MEVLNRLVDKGNTVLIIEHNLDVIKTVDYIIDIGPEGGKKGGKIITAGTCGTPRTDPGGHRGSVGACSRQSPNRVSHESDGR